MLDKTRAGTVYERGATVLSCVLRLMTQKNPPVSLGTLFTTRALGR